MQGHTVQPGTTISCIGFALLLWCSSHAAHADEEQPTVDSVLGSPETPTLDPKKLESNGAVIGTITINNRNIFDLSNPLEDKWLYQWANRLHVITKPRVIESQLLFEKGDIYSLRLTEETERILRQHSYLVEADVTPVKFENGVVDLEVETIDVWTLTPELSLGRSGGENRLAIGIVEQNLLGRGIELGAKYKTNVDRDTLSLSYDDTNFLLDRYVLGVNYANSSDGFFRRFQFGKPFYALDRPRAGNVFYSRGEQVDQLYDRGNVVAEFNQQFAYHEASFGLSRGLVNGWVKRLSAGLAYSKNEFAESPDMSLPVTVIPDDREYLYPFVGFELIEDSYEKTVNFDQIHRTEDRFLGVSWRFRLGYSSKSAGSTADAWHYQAGFRNTLVNTKSTSLTVRSSLTGRWQANEAQDALLSAAMRFHRRIGDNQLFYARLSGTAGKNLDIDKPLYLGGETGLRGYPLRYQNGDSRALLTLEQRFFTNWYLFRLVHVGAAIFFDAGRTWGVSPVGAPNLGILKDVGFGLRLGNTRSGTGKVLHIDLAFPLDGENDIDSVQLLIDAKSSF